MTIRIVHRVCVTVGCTAGLCLNSLLVYLIVSTRTKELRAYSKLLLQIAICDIIATAIIGIIQPMVVDVRKNQYLLVNGFLRFVPQPWAHILCMMILFTHYFLLTSVAVQYIFRYLLICRSMKITKKVYACLLLYPFTMASINIGHAHFGYLPRPEDEQMSAEDLGEFLLEPGETSVHIGSVMKTNAPESFISFVISMAIIISVYVLVAFCMYKIHSKLKAMKASFSMKTNNLQRALTKVLIIQALNPIIFQIIPTFLVNFLSYFTVGGVIATIVIVWGPVSNALVTIILIKPYRRKIAAVLCDKRHIHTIARTTETEKNRKESTAPRIISIQ